MQADPFDPLYIAQLHEQFMQIALAVKIQAIIRKVLSDQHQLLRSACGQLPRAFHQLFDRCAHVFSAHQRYRTERAFPIATFTDLEIRVVCRCAQQAFAQQFNFQIGLQGLEQPRQLACAEPGIHLRYPRLQFRPVALAQATGHVHLFHQAVLFRLGIGKYGVYAFLFRAFNETAGIDHHHIVIAAGRSMVHLHTVGSELRHHHFTVESVLRAAKGHHVHPGLLQRPGLHAICKGRGFPPLPVFFSDRVFGRIPAQKRPGRAVRCTPPTAKAPWSGVPLPSLARWRSARCSRIATKMYRPSAYIPQRGTSTPLWPTNFRFPPCVSCFRHAERAVRN